MSSIKFVRKKALINNASLVLISKRNASSQTSSSTTTKTNKLVQFDIVICGGGLSGAAMARSLGVDTTFRHLKIALIESSAKKNVYTKPNIHLSRVCALNHKTIELFKCNYYKKKTLWALRAYS